MSGDQSLINKFDVCDETKLLAQKKYRQAKTIMTAGSGRALGQMSAGLPAVCVLLAVEELNSGEITMEVAQKAACLTPKEFQKVYDTVEAALKQSTFVSYRELFVQLKASTMEEKLAPFITKAENILMKHTNEEKQSSLFRCAIVFWILNLVKKKSTPSTEGFVASQKIPFKAFCNLLNLLNNHAVDLQKELQHFSTELASPRKPSASGAAFQPTGGESSHSNSGDKTPNVSTPTKRSLGGSPNQNDNTPLRQSPRKRGAERSPTKIAQPSLVFTPPGRKRPLRELPSKASPKKSLQLERETTKDEDENTTGTPAKKRRTDSLSQATPANVSPTKKMQKSIFPSAPTAPSQNISTYSADVDTEPNPFMDTPAGIEGSDDDEDPDSMRRFRPVYLEHRQWCARDPRLARSWAKADSHKKTAK